MQKIIFTLEFGDEWIPKEYYPVPGVKSVPEWYKTMKSSFNKKKADDKVVRESQTMKRCMPVLDSITAGYILKTHTDIYIKDNDGKELTFEWANDSKGTVSFHPPQQVLDYKNLDLPQGAPKLRNPWSIKTPKGYSCLFVSPLHRPKCGITILEGIVDTDKYHAAVQFPFLVDDGFEGTVPAGTPVVQVIPFKRASFRMEIGDVKNRQEAQRSHSDTHATWINGYRAKFRTNKDYL